MFIRRRRPEAGERPFVPVSTQVRALLWELNPELVQAADVSRRIASEQLALGRAETLARMEAQAIKSGERYPTFWDRYNELRAQYGLPPAPRPQA